MNTGYVVGALVAVLSLGSTAHAQPAKPVKPIAQPKPTTPIKPVTVAKPPVTPVVAKPMKPMTPPAAIGTDVKLSQQTRLQQIREAVVAAGVVAPEQAPGPLARVTPISAANDTARIEIAAIGAFLGPSEARPNGAFNVHAEDKGGYLEIVLPAAANKVNVIDCAASSSARKLAFITGNWEVTHSPIRDGHAMYAVRPTTNSIRFRLVVPGNKPWSFHGCEITAMP